MKRVRKINLILLAITLLVMMLTACNSAEGAGSYKGSAPGYHGDLSVVTEIDQEGKIVNIIVDEHDETENIGTIAIEKIPSSIIQDQSLEVDTVAGATVTSDGIINAVADSLKTAGLDASNYGYTAAKDESEAVEAVSINKDAMPIKQEITGSVMITDVKGREVEIDLPISSYAISTMDVIDYIIPLKGEDAFKMLVGSGQDGGKGIQKYQKLYTPIVGNYMEHTGQISDHNAPFDLEMILSTEPDVIIVNSAMAAHKYALEIEDQLTQAGIDIILIDVPGKEMEKSVQETMQLLGQIFQEEDKASQVTDFIDEQYELIASKKLDQRDDKPTVYYEKSGYSEIYGSTATSISGWGNSIALAGAVNIADEILMDSAASQGGGNTVDPEYVLESDPDYIIVSGINDGWLDGIKETTTEPEFDIVNRNGWNNLKAIKNKDMYEFAHSTNRSIYAFYPCLKMAKIFYPDEFKDIEPEAKLKEFFDKFMLVDSDITTWFTYLK